MSSFTELVMRLDPRQRRWALAGLSWLFVVGPITCFILIPDAPRVPIKETWDGSRRIYLLDADAALDFGYDPQAMMHLVGKDMGLDYNAMQQKDAKLGPLELLRYSQCIQSGNTSGACIGSRFVADARKDFGKASDDAFATSYDLDSMRDAGRYVLIEKQLRPADGVHRYGLVRVRNPQLFTEAFASVHSQKISEYRFAVLRYAALVWLGPLLLFGAGVVWARRGVRH